MLTIRQSEVIKLLRRQGSDVPPDVLAAPMDTQFCYGFTLRGFAPLQPADRPIVGCVPGLMVCLDPLEGRTAAHHWRSI